jgi:hypothetical protein
VKEWQHNDELKIGMFDKENEEKLITFVQMKGLWNHTSQIGWVQMEASGTDSFADLLRGILAQLNQMDVLDDSKMFTIGSLPCRVCHCPTGETRVADRVTCTLAPACAALPIAGNHHVQCFFDSDPILKKTDSFAVLMQTQHRRFYPIDMKATTFIVYKGGDHCLHLSVLEDIEAPEDDELMMEEPPEE